MIYSISKSITTTKIYRCIRPIQPIVLSRSTTPAPHAPATVLALTPHLAAWCKILMDGALGVAGTNAAAIAFDKLGQVGVLYHGLEVLGGGSILIGLTSAPVGVFVIEKKFVEASSCVVRRGLAQRC